MKVWSIVEALLGLGRGGQILYRSLFILAIPAAIAWTIVLPRMRFHDEDERLFRAARHGDTAGVEQALDAGAGVDAAAPIDGKTAVFRAAVFGHADTVRALVTHGADLGVRGNDGKTLLEVVMEARSGEHNPAKAAALDGVAAVLRENGATP